MVENSSTLKGTTVALMKHIYNKADDFTLSCKQKSRLVLESHDISCSQLAISLGHSSIFKGMLCSTSRRDFVAACYKAFFQLSQHLGVFTPDPLLLRDECLQIVRTFHEEAEKHHYTLPNLGPDEKSFKSKLNGMVRQFVNEDPYFLARFHGQPPQKLVTAVRDYAMGFEVNLSLDDLGEFLWNNIE